MNIGDWKKIFTPDFWKKQEESVLGIDIGSSSIKLVQLRKKKEKAILETYGELSVGPYAGVEIGRAAHLVDEKAAEMIKVLMKETGAKAKRASVAIPLRSSFLTTIELPLVSEEQLKEAVPLEARKYVPVPIAEVLLDWWVLPKSLEEDEGDRKQPSQPATEVLLAAIHQDVVEKYKKVVSQAGLEIDSFEIEVFSTVRSVFDNDIAPVLVIDIGAATTKMAVVDYGIVRFAYFADKGSQDFTVALAKGLGLGFSEAEKMKREIGLSPLPEDREKTEVFESLLDYIFREAERVMIDYRRKRGRSVSRIVLTGGGSLFKGGLDFAVKKFGLEVSQANPFSKTEHPAFLEPALKEVGPSFSVALGLALRQLRS